MIRFLVCCLALMFFYSCKKTPTDSNNVAVPELAGSYVGWGTAGGIAQNIRMEFTRTDSSEFEGTVLFGGTGEELVITEVSLSEDSVRFEFTRALTYRYLGVVSTVSVTLFVLEPVGQPTYILSKELNGRNLSGDWNGLMYSQFLETTQHADLFLDQQGSLYDGDVQSVFGFYTLLGNITSGTIDGDGMYFAGMAPFSGEQYPFRFDGVFVNRDSINGYWELDVTGGGDAGTFAFNRSF